MPVGSTSAKVGSVEYDLTDDGLTNIRVDNKPLFDTIILYLGMSVISVIGYEIKYNKNLKIKFFYWIIRYISLLKRD